MVQQETTVSSVKTVRTVMIIAGLVVAYSAIFVPSDFWSLALFVVGLGLVLWGSYLWAKLKGRSGVWMLLGFLAPAGLIGLLFLHEKAPGQAPPPQPPPPRGVT